MLPARNEPAPDRIYRFGPFAFSARDGELRRNNRRVHLQEQPSRILAVLLGHPGQVVTREALHRELWPADTFVDFDMGLNTAVRKLRQSLGDNADRPRFVETVARRGYRFIAAVSLADPITPTSPSTTAAASLAVAKPLRADAPPLPEPSPEPPSTGTGQPEPAVFPSPASPSGFSEEEIDWNFWVSLANPSPSPAPAAPEQAEPSWAARFGGRWSIVAVCGAALLLIALLFGLRLH